MVKIPHQKRAEQRRSKGGASPQDEAETHAEQAMTARSEGRHEVRST